MKIHSSIFTLVCYIRHILDNIYTLQVSRKNSKRTEKRIEQKKITKTGLKNLLVHY